MEAYITSHIGIIILILIWNSSRPLYNLYHYSGVRLVVEKIFPPKNAVLNSDEFVKPSSFVPWVLGLYVALFSIASARYDRAVNSYEMRTTAWQAQMATPHKAKACTNISSIQKNKVPVKPDLFSFWNTFSSLISDEKYEDGHETILRTIEAYQTGLQNAIFTDASLKGLILFNANLNGAQIHDVDLTNSLIYNTDMKKIGIKDTDFTDTIFVDTKLEDAIIIGSNMKNTYFLTSIDPKLPAQESMKAFTKSIHQHLLKNTTRHLKKTASLYKTTLPPEIETELKETHPHLFEKPDWYEED